MKGFQATVLASLGNHIVNLEVSQRVENYIASLCIHSFKTETLDKWSKSVMRINTLSYDKIPGISPDSPNSDRQDILEEWVSIFTVWNNIWMGFLACVLSRIFQVLFLQPSESQRVKVTYKKSEWILRFEHFLPSGKRNKQINLILQYTFGKRSVHCSIAQQSSASYSISCSCLLTHLSLFSSERS